MTYQLTKDNILEIKKCAEDICYFAETYCKIISLDEGLINFKLYDKQKVLLKNFKKNRFNIVLASRQFGKTITSACYLLYHAIFFENSNICLLADQESHAIEILERVKIIIEYLPDFLKPELIENNKKTIKIDNGSKIFCAPTTSKSIRGQSLAVLYLDEFSIVPNTMAEEFIQNAWPTITSGTKTKVIISSTPKGLNHFWSFWTKAERGLNNFIPIRVDWWERPGRDEKWKKEQIATIGEQAFLQEFGNCVTKNTLIKLKNKITNEEIEVSFDEFINYYN